MYLFDMDETISFARKVISKDMVNLILRLSKKDKIGIVSGSDISKIKEQLSPLIDSIDEIDIFSCNGTFYYKKNNKDLFLVKKVCMRESVGTELYKNTIKKILKLQTSFSSIYNFKISPPFIEDRGSMINWSPIGRMSDFDTRIKFYEFDNEHHLRKEYVDILNSCLNRNDSNKIKISLGGKTSIDIFPIGWDKTFVFNYINKDNIVFFGDKCKPGENDYEIYNSLPNGKRYFVSDPLDTMSIIKSILD